MGYHAYGSGAIELTRNADDAEVRAVLDDLNDVYGHSNSPLVFWVEKQNPATLCVEHEFGWNYWGEEVEYVLGRLAPYTKGGFVCFVGDDESHWKFEFDRESGAWVEYQGEITYEITRDKIKKAEQCLVDNGIDEDEAAVVLQALGYILLDKEIY